MFLLILKSLRFLIVLCALLLVGFHLLVIGSLAPVAEPQELLFYTNESVSSPPLDPNPPLDACQKWEGVMAPQVVEKEVLSKPPPRALVMTLMHGHFDLKQWACGSIPTQLEHLIEPLGMDLLIVVSGKKLNEEGPDLAECLNLTTSTPNPKEWKNLDGTTMLTTEYRHGASRVYIAMNYTMVLPKYVQNNLTILEEPKDPPACEASEQYIQGTRWYTHAALHLGILEHYDYWIKLDVDIVFLKRIPFHLLHDMQIKNAVFAHTAHYPDIGCSKNIVNAVKSFEEHVLKTNPKWRQERNWTGMCSADIREMKINSDYFYSNFVIGSVKFWQSPEVLHFSRFLSEVPSGFFRHRWTDQIFFHFAMGLFLGPNFFDAVVDYTELRCSPVKNCWWKVFDPNYSDKTTPSWERCDNGAYFVHTKNVVKFLKAWNGTSSKQPLQRDLLPHVSTYDGKGCT